MNEIVETAAQAPVAARHSFAAALFGFVGSTAAATFFLMLLGSL